MLASIHPLGERARRQRWGVTVAAYLLSTVFASALLGVALGLVGGWLGVPPLPALVVALAVAGVALDLRLGGLSLPTIHRQVDEEMLTRYRGWVYGASYGFQLGLGVVTVVNSFAVYLALVLALLTGSAAGGLAVGLAFGLSRGLVVLAAARVRDPSQLRRLHQRLQAWGPASHRLAVGTQGAVAAVVAATLVA
ncbi:MAG TPA: sulfite exporter TauE/SafE family protein [Acidimicrobiales bacterium]|nr:sulfite exporter TauE/SafE family protein [Acidimicrobiales bacterium]